MDTIREIDPISMSISVDAGAILKNVQDAAATAGLLLPLSLGAEGSCRIGGNIGTNAGGLSVVRVRDDARSAARDRGSPVGRHGGLRHAQATEEQYRLRRQTVLRRKRGNSRHRHRRSVASRAFADPPRDCLAEARERRAARRASRLGPSRIRRPADHVRIHGGPINRARERKQ